MSIYQELQLNQAGSKALIRNSKDSREKRRHLLIYVFKVFLTLAFCMAFVTAYTKIFGEDNSVDGVVVVLTGMVFRSADLGIKASHGMGVIVILFAVLAVGPRLTHMVPAGWAFLLDFVFLLLLLTLGCHNIIMANHATWVLGYLLLQGNDVSGHAYFMRVLALALGALLTALVFYRNHREITYKRGLRDLLGEFALSSARTKWQLRMALGISSGMFFAQLLHLPRVMWAGFAMMSIIQPFRKDLLDRFKYRFPGNAIGCVLFFGLCAVLPESFYGCIGMLGGVGVGFSATYLWQTVFNSFGALAMATGMFGMTGSMALRLANNLFGVVYGLVFDFVFEKVCCAAERISRGTESADAA